MVRSILNVFCLPNKRVLTQRKLELTTILRPVLYIPASDYTQLTSTTGTTMHGQPKRKYILSSEQTLKMGIKVPV